MTPKEKAIELVEGFSKIQRDFKQANYYGQARESALFSVDQQISLINYMNEFGDFPKILSFWISVKDELKKL
jgi:hypothetical protein